MKRALGWTAGVAFVAASWFVAAATPAGEDRLADPFVVTADVGESVTGRNIGATVHEMTIADRVTYDGWFGEGTWLVVNLDAWAIETESPGALSGVYLVIGERTFRASERPGSYDTEASLFRTGLHLGIPQTGSLAFELPADVLEDQGTLQLAISDFLDADSVIEVPVDFAALPHTDEVALTGTGWANP